MLMSVKFNIFIYKRDFQSLLMLATGTTRQKFDASGVDTCPVG